jgi:hypothetical protein
VAPLGRWEYLAADLAERVYRAGSSGRQRGAGAERTLDAAVEDPHAERGSKAPACPAAERVYCRLDSREPLAQLPLLPIEPERLVPDLLRHVQGRLGAEGVRQAVLVLAACAGAEPGEAALLDKAALAAACGAATRRAARERSRVLGAVLYLLGAVTIQRVGAGESSERVRTARLITVLGWEGAQRPHGAAQAYGAAQAHGAAHGHGAAEEPVPGTWERVTLLADRVLWDAAGRPLGAALRELPPAVVALSPREHPHALAAAAWLLRHFSAQPGAAVQRSGPALLHEMGLADGPGALAGLKRDLQRLRELGAIGRWHQARGADGALHLRMEPPGMAGAAREVHHGGLRGAERTGARLARRKRMGGGSDWAVS